MSVAIITVDEACEILRCGRSRLFELARERRLRRAPKFGRRTVFYRADIEKLLEPKPSLRIKERLRMVPTNTLSEVDRIRALDIDALLRE